MSRYQSRLVVNSIQRLKSSCKTTLVYRMCRLLVNVIQKLKIKWTILVVLLLQACSKSHRKGNIKLVNYSISAGQVLRHPMETITQIFLLFQRLNSYVILLYKSLSVLEIYLCHQDLIIVFNNYLLKPKILLFFKKQIDFYKNK